MDALGEVVTAFFGGGGIVAFLFKLYLKTVEARIEDLKDALDKERQRSDKAVEAALVANSALASYEEFINQVRDNARTN